MKLRFWVKSCLIFATFFEFILSNNLFASSYRQVRIDLLPSGDVEAFLVAKFVLFVAALLLTTVIVGKILKVFFRLPIVAGQIIGGIILGPSLFNIKKFAFFTGTLNFADPVKKCIYSIAHYDLFLFFILLISSGITVSYLLWLAGHETDIKDMAKVGMESILAGILGAVIPIFLVTLTAYFCFGSSYSFASSLGLSVVFAATSVSIPITLLIKRNKMYLRTSKVTMGAAVVDDIFAVILFSFFLILLQGGSLGEASRADSFGQLGHNRGIGDSLLHMLIAFIIMFIGGRFFITPVTKLLRRMKLSNLLPPFAILMMFAFFSLAELVGGLAGITGAYFAGLFHRMGDHKHRAVRAISPFVNSIFLPLFLGTIGLQVDVGALKLTDWLVVLVLLFVAVFSKFAPCYLTTAFTNLFIKDKTKKWSLLENFIMGSSLVARGEVGLVIATLLNTTALMTPTQYIICVVVIVLTTIVSPVMLSVGLRKQDEMARVSPLEFSITIGPLKYLSLSYLFDVICANLEIHEKIRQIVDTSEGEKILTVSEETKIILQPERGITFKGNEPQIRKILDDLKTSLHKDLDVIPGTVWDH